jgi:hypothetical protein
VSLAEQSGPALYERNGTGPVTLYSGQERWSLIPAEGRPWTMNRHDGGHRARPAVEALDSWLTARRQPAKTVRRGLCPLTLLRVAG